MVLSIVTVRSEGVVLCQPATHYGNLVLFHLTVHSVVTVPSIISIHSQVSVLSCFQVHSRKSAL